MRRSLPVRVSPKAEIHKTHNRLLKYNRASWNDFPVHAGLRSDVSETEMSDGGRTALALPIVEAGILAGEGD